jgi:hypothetical protein
MTRYTRSLFFVSHAVRLVHNAFLGLIRPLEDATKFIRAWNVAAAQAGGATGFGVGIAAGMGPGGFQSQADAFRQRLASDPLTVMAYGKAMLPPEYGGPQDTTRELQKAILKLAGIMDEDTRLMTARRMQLQPFLNLSYANRDLLEQTFALDERSNRRFKGARTAIQNADQIGAQADEYRALFLGKFSVPGHTLWQNLRRNVWSALEGEYGMMPEIRRIWSREDTGHKGEESTRATKDLTQEIRFLAGLLKQERGISGGGDRTRAAIPPGLTGLRLGQAIASDQLRLGGIVK